MSNELTTNDKKQHLIWIDLARCIAIACVILVHTTESVYRFNVDYMNTVGISTKIVAFSLFTIGRFGVPVFVFISGYLLLGREYDEKKSKHFWKNNLLNLVIVVEIWIVIYNVFLMWFNKTPFSITELLKNMLFLKATAISHMWYMPMIIGMYIFVPFVANCLQKINLETLKFPFYISIVFVFCVPVLNVYLNAMGKQPVSTQLDLHFSGDVYGILLILGYAMKKGIFHKVKKRVLAFWGIISFGITIGIQLWAYTHGYAYNVWYNCLTLIVTTVCLFELLSRIKVKHLRTCIESLAKCSFGIYLIHNMLIMVLNRIIRLPYALVNIILIYIISLSVSWTVVNLASKNKRISRMLFFIR